MSIDDLSILIAHGDEDTRTDLVEAVNGLHSVVEQCATVAEFRGAVLRNRPDLIITGVWFPDGDGIETAIKLGEQRPIPCVVSTATRSLELVHRAMEDHVMAYLIEPVRPEDLQAAIVVAWSRFEQLRELEAEVEDLRTALEHRKTIERAKGLLMADRSITESEAFGVIRRRSQDRRLRIVDIASEILGQHDAAAASEAEQNGAVNRMPTEALD
ncbi:MAG: ANTAR domain-containing response regulator [Phycisphaerales bacterium]